MDLLTRFTRRALTERPEADPRWAHELADLYVEIQKEYDIPRRREILTEFMQRLEASKGPAHALYPFAWIEDDPELVSSACLGMSILHGVTGGDVLEGPRHVVEMATSGCTDPTRSGYMLRGPLLLGDRRLSTMLREAIEGLPVEAQIALVPAWSGFVYAAMVDLYLDWLALGPSDGVYGTVAGWLASAPERAVVDTVLEVERKLPVWSENDDEAVRVVAQWSFADYAERIAPRMRRLAEVENEPCLMPAVLAAWGGRLAGARVRGLPSAALRRSPRTRLP